MNKRYESFPLTEEIIEKLEDKKYYLCRGKYSNWMERQWLNGKWQSAFPVDEIMFEQPLPSKTAEEMDKGFLIEVLELYRHNEQSLEAMLRAIDVYASQLQPSTVGETTKLIDWMWENDFQPMDEPGYVWVDVDDKMFTAKELYEKFIAAFPSPVSLPKQEEGSEDLILKERQSPSDFLREKYKLVDFAGLNINGKSWLELMKEYSDSVMLRENVFNKNIFDNITKQKDDIIIKTNEKYYKWQKEKEELNLQIKKMSAASPSDEEIEKEAKRFYIEDGFSGAEFEDVLNCYKSCIEWLSSHKQVREDKDDAIRFAKWASENNWKLNGNGELKQQGYWIQFRGRGRGYKKETSEGLYKLFSELPKEETK